MREISLTQSLLGLLWLHHGGVQLQHLVQDHLPDKLDLLLGHGGGCGGYNQARTQGKLKNSRTASAVDWVDIFKEGILGCINCRELRFLLRTQEGVLE